MVSRPSRAALATLAIAALCGTWVRDASADPTAKAPTAPPAAPAAPAAPAGDPKAAEDPVVDAAAKMRFAEGVKLYGTKKYELARVAFLQAYLLKKQPQTQLALAQAALRTGRAVEAVGYFHQYLRENPNPPEKVRARIEASLQEARAFLASVTINAPPGAEVFVDDVPVGKTPLPTALDLAPGTHQLKVELGDDSTTESVSLGAGGSIAIVLVPKAKQKGVPPPAKLKAPTPVTPSTVPGETSSILSPPNTTWPMYTAGAIGLLGFGSAVVWGSLLANSNKGAQVGRDALAAAGMKPERCLQPTAGTQYDDVCNAIIGNIRGANDQKAAFTASLVVGSVGLGFAVLWFLVAPKEQAVVPSVQKDGAGATFITTF